MTREKEIRQEIDFQLAGSFGNYSEGYEEGFIAGAKWADETMIDKACDWIQMNAQKYMHSIGGCMYFDVVNSTKDFKKAMET